MSERYNLSQIHTLLTEGFTDEEIRQLCYYTPEFRPVYDQLAQTTGKTEVIRRLVEHAERKDLLENLLDWAKEYNPTKYDKYSPYWKGLEKPESLPTNKPVTKTRTYPMKTIGGIIVAIATIVPCILSTCSFLGIGNVLDLFRIPSTPTSISQSISPEKTEPFSPSPTPFPWWITPPSSRQPTSTPVPPSIVDETSVPPTDTPIPPTDTPIPPSSQLDIDPNMWYRLTNKFLGEGRALDVSNDGENEPFMGQTGNYNSQYWKLTPLGEGYYRLTNKFLGEDRVLDTRNDNDKNAPFMGQTGDYTGEYWKLTPLGEGYYRLTNKFLGEDRALDTHNDNDKNAPFMGQTGDYTGEYWKLTPIEPIK